MNATTLFIVFVILSIINVVLNTLKTTITVKGGALAAAAINAITFFVYTYVIIYTNCDLPMFLKASVTGIINFVGVYAVKWFEAKARKDKLWKVEATIPARYADAVDFDLKVIPHNYTMTSDNQYAVFNIYCATQKDSITVKPILNQYNAKYFVSETKVL